MNDQNCTHYPDEVSAALYDFLLIFFSLGQKVKTFSVAPCIADFFLAAFRTGGL